MPFPDKFTELCAKLLKPMKNPAKVLGISAERMKELHATQERRPDATPPNLELRAIVFLLRNDGNGSYGAISRWITDNRQDLLQEGQTQISKARVYDIWLKALRDRGDERVLQYKLPFAQRRRNARRRLKRRKPTVNPQFKGMGSRAALDSLLK